MHPWASHRAAARSLLVATASALACGTWASDVLAQGTITQPGAHPRYSFDAEPHLLIRDSGHYGDRLGLGFRGTIPVVHNGFVRTINNSVGIGFGVDALLFGDEHCHGNPNDDGYCHNHNEIVLPLVMQWNFWLHRNWSVFGEPGLAIVLDDDHGDDDLDIEPIVFSAGGRWHFSNAAALTMRLGGPRLSLSIGVSFLM